MPPKSNNQKKKEAEAAGKAPKKTKQQENAGKSASQKKAEMQVRMKMANIISNFAASLRLCICEAFCKINPNQKKKGKEEKT